MRTGISGYCGKDEYYIPVKWGSAIFAKIYDYGDDVYYVPVDTEVVYKTDSAVQLVSNQANTDKVCLDGVELSTALNTPMGDILLQGDVWDDQYTIKGVIGDGKLYRDYVAYLKAIYPNGAGYTELKDGDTEIWSQWVEIEIDYDAGMHTVSASIPFTDDFTGDYELHYSELPLEFYADAYAADSELLTDCDWWELDDPMCLPSYYFENIETPTAVDTAESTLYAEWTEAYSQINNGYGGHYKSGLKDIGIDLENEALLKWFSENVTKSDKATITGIKHCTYFEDYYVVVDIENIEWYCPINADDSCDVFTALDRIVQDYLFNGWLNDVDTVISDMFNMDIDCIVGDWQSRSTFENVSGSVAQGVIEFFYNHIMDSWCNELIDNYTAKDDGETWEDHIEYLVCKSDQVREEW